jgi:F-type H+-transporting ATPase subunit epsilon
MDTIKLSIVTPNGQIFNDYVKSVTLPGTEGEFGVLPNHASLVSSLTVGVIEIYKKKTVEAVAINWGHVKVSSNTIDVLVDGAVAINSTNEATDMEKKINLAKELVNSVEDTNVSMVAVNAKIKSFA